MTPALVPALDVVQSWITLSGTNFPPPYGLDSYYCLFAVSKGLGFRYLSSTEVACKCPGLNGAVDVSVTFNSGVSFVASPTPLVHFLMTGFSPNKGDRRGGGRPVLVQGSRFADAGPGKLLCIFGGIKVAATLLSSSQISCVPPGFDPVLMAHTRSSSGSYTVTFGVTCNGVFFSYATGGSAYVYYNTPVVLSLFPDSGHTSGKPCKCIISREEGEDG